MVNYTRDELAKIVSESVSKSEVCRKLGLRPVGGNFRRVSDDIKKYGIDISHFTGRPRPGNMNAPLHLDTILDNGLPCSSTTLKNRLLREGYKEHRCEVCGNTTWQNQPIPLELHHINGIHDDNHRDNILLVCPNCHALTDTFRGRKPTVRYDHVVQCRTESGNTYQIRKQRIKECPVCHQQFTGSNKKYCSEMCCRIGRGDRRPNPLELLDKLKAFGSYLQTGKYYNVTDTAVRKWIKLYKLEDPLKKKTER